MLKPVEREQLTVAMLKDVLSVLRKSRQVGSVTVVSADKNARSISRRFGANFLWEGKRRGLNKGLKLAISDSERRGASSVLVIHSDLPLLKPREIDEFLEESQGYSVSLTPSKDGAGTNALLMRPPRVIRPVFGRDSFRRHLSLAMKRNARSRVLRFRGISFDVDKPRDLVNLMRRPLRNETGKFLRTLRKRS
jgi:2-phospho-L-lactate guanylyltransferase